MRCIVGFQIFLFFSKYFKNIEKKKHELTDKVDIK